MKDFGAQWVMKDEPDEPFVTEEHLDYLDRLRESGVANMYGAAPYLVEEFGVSRAQARRILADWMRTFAERHPRSGEGER
jgi:hypothetical protein